MEKRGGDRGEISFKTVVKLQLNDSSKVSGRKTLFVQVGTNGSVSDLSQYTV